MIEIRRETQDPARQRALIRAGLAGELPETNPKYFYDDRGSALFEEICDLPEYYQTRTERALLQTIAPQIVARARPSELVELGAGAATKTRVVLDAMARAGRLRRFVSLDVSEGIVRRVAAELVREYPGLRVHGVVADFMEQMGELPATSGDTRLVLFLGGTIGNFRPAEAHEFLLRLRAHLHAGDFFLLGADLVKDRARLEAAYNDSRGVTAEFNKNVLRVLNGEVGADFDPDGFDHRAFYDIENRWIEMRLVSNRRQTVQLPGIDFEMRFERGSEIRTEISAKHDRASIEALLGASGFELLEWFTDPESLFALTLARSS
jgi:L-histidine N-alpha-methyltransferase